MATDTTAALSTVIAKKAIRILVDGKTKWINPGQEFTPASQADLDTYVKFDAIYPSRRAATSAARAMEGVKVAEAQPDTNPDADRLKAEAATALAARIAEQQARRDTEEREAQAEKDRKNGANRGVGSAPKPSADVV